MPACTAPPVRCAGPRPSTGGSGASPGHERRFGVRTTCPACAKPRRTRTAAPGCPPAAPRGATPSTARAARSRPRCSPTRPRPARRTCPAAECLGQGLDDAEVAWWKAMDADVVERHPGCVDDRAGVSLGLRDRPAVDRPPCCVKYSGSRVTSTASLRCGTLPTTRVDLRGVGSTDHHGSGTSPTSTQVERSVQSAMLDRVSGRSRGRCPRRRRGSTGRRGPSRTRSRCTPC